MSLTSLMVRPVTILTAGTRTDGYGDTTLDWTSPTSESSNGWLAQQSSSDSLDGRNATTTALVLDLPAGTPITAQDRVVIDGVTYEVSAGPMSAWTPRGEHHIECQLRLVRG